MPISSTSTSVSSGAPRIVTGRPCSLLKLRSLAATRQRRASTARVEVLAVVLPTLPVMPTTRRGSRSRAQRPRSISARSVSSTSIAVLDRERWVRGTGREVGGGAGGDRGGDESWPSRSATSGTNSCPGSMARESNDAPSTSTSGPTQPAAGRHGHVGCPDPHGAERYPGAPGTGRYRADVRRTADPPRRAVRRAVGRARRAAASPPPTCSRRRSRALPRHADRHLATAVAARRGRHAGARRRTGRAPGPARADRPGDGRRPVLAEPPRPASAPSCCRCCTARWARTARCRACSSWPTSPTSAPACSARRWRWTRRWPSRCSPPRHPPGALPGVRRARAHARHARATGRRARAAVLRQAGEHGLVGRRQQGQDGRGAARRDRARPDLRRVGRRRGGRRRAARSRSPCSATSTRGRRCPARSSPGTSSTTTRTSTSTTAPSCSSRRR